MEGEPQMTISEEPIDAFEGDEEIIKEELKQDYSAEDYIKQNEELLRKLAIAENTLERKKGFKKNGEPRKKAEMTEKRKQAIEKMKEGRKKWLEQKRKEKEMLKIPPQPKKKTGEKTGEKTRELDEDNSEYEEEVEIKPKRKPRKVKKRTKKIIVEPETESSEEEEEIIVVKAPRRRKKKAPPKKVIYEDYSDEEDVVSPDPQIYTSQQPTQNDFGYGGIRFK